MKININYKTMVLVFQEVANENQNSVK